MKIVEIVENLQEENSGTVILVKNGIFFVAIGKDAIFLSRKMGLKKTCMKDGLCKVGFLVKTADKYIEKMKKENISFALYIIDKNKISPEQIYRNIGEDNTEKKACLDCTNCVQRKETDTDIINKIRNQFNKQLTCEKLLEAHRQSQKGKTTKKEVILFNLKREEYINWLYGQLKNGTYKHGGYKIFYVHVPKERKIQVSRYIDRIVHRWIVDNFLKEYFMKSFIHNTYACIPERGMHKAVLDLQRTMKHCKRIWGEYYIIKMDVAKYFQNVDRKILLEILERKIEDEKLLNLIDKIIYSSEGEKGLPIGNYTSQTFANIYLNELDQYIKHDLRVKYYFRYMDDFIILVKEKEKAIKLLTLIRKFLDKRLKLQLNSKTQIIKSKNGVNYCGYKVNEYRLKIRDRGKRNLKLKIKQLDTMIRKGKISSEEAYKYITGHIGYINIANVKTLTSTLFYEEEQFY